MKAACVRSFSTVYDSHRNVLCVTHVLRRHVTLRDRCVTRLVPVALIPKLSMEAKRLDAYV